MHLSARRGRQKFCTAHLRKIFFKCVFLYICLSIQPVFFVYSVVPGHFKINDKTGEIFTARPLDYENLTSYVVKVRADSLDMVQANKNVTSRSKTGDFGGGEV